MLEAPSSDAPAPPRPHPRLLSDLDGLEWGDSIKEMQRNWIGRSEGASVRFALRGGDGAALPAGTSLDVFTTRPDTLCGVTYMVVAPEHPLLSALASSEQAAEVASYAEAATRKSDLERTELAKQKTGVFTGACGTRGCGRCGWWAAGGHLGRDVALAHAGPPSNSTNCVRTTARSRARRLVRSQPCYGGGGAGVGGRLCAGVVRQRRHHGCAWSRRAGL